MKKASRISAFFLSLALLLALLPVGALAADDAKATTLRLEDTEGTVTVANARGKTLTTKAGSKLYSGYSVATSSASYAWISLDDDVVVKLDAGSKATVKQDGKKLEIQLDSGNLLFNVGKPLEDDASLDIRTSSMSTGVRGTAGLVSVSERSQSAVNSAGETVYAYVASSRLVILEGTVTLTYNNAPVAGADVGAEGWEAATAQVTSGWQADVLKTTSVVGQGAGATQTTDVKAEVQPVSVKDTLLSSGYAAVEIAANPALRDRVTQAENDLDEAIAAEIVKEAPALLKEEQKAATQTAKELEKAVEQALEQAKEEVKKESAAAAPGVVVPVFPPPAPPSPGQSGSGSSPTPAPSPAVDWTVTFQYKGAPYATQTVRDGTAAAQPVLRPAKDGAWKLDGVAYDFAQPVTGDLTLSWEAQ